MFNDIKTGVIGVGSMGQNHARIYKEISNLVAVADPDEQQGRKVAKRLGVKWYKNYYDMLDEVDAVTIAVPTVMHREVAETVISFGVNLLVEKPLAENVADADEIISAAIVADVTLAVGHVERHNPVVAYAKRSIENREWGEMITMSSKRLSNYPKRIRDVGVILDLAVHDIDVMCYLIDCEVKDVLSMEGYKESQEYEDHATILLDFENQIKGICEVNWLTPLKVRKLSLTCTGAFIEIDFTNQLLTESSLESFDVNDENLYLSEQEVEYKTINIPKEEPLKRELTDFLKCIDLKQSPLVTGADGRRVIELVNRINKKC